MFYVKTFLNHPNSFHRATFKLNEKLDADSLLYSLSHFECDSHTVHMLTQWHLPPPLTTTMKLPLFMHVHSSPLSLAGRLCHLTNRSRNTNNGWTFSGQTSYILKRTDVLWLKLTLPSPNGLRLLFDSLELGESLNRKIHAVDLMLEINEPHSSSLAFKGYCLIMWAGANSSDRIVNILHL